MASVNHPRFDFQSFDDEIAAILDRPIYHPPYDRLEALDDFTALAWLEADRHRIKCDIAALAIAEFSNWVEE